MMNEHFEELFSQKNPWQNNPNSIWLASTISLHRNLEKFKFPSKMGADRRQQLISLISKEVSTSNLLTNPILLKAEDLTPHEKEFLVEHFLAVKSYQQAHVGEAFILDHTGTFLATLNVEDHLVMLVLDTQENLEESWNRLVAIETQVGENLGYAFSKRYGFLTSDPSQCGTGLSTTLYLHIPALIHEEKIEEVLDKLADDSITITGMQGSPSEIIGDLLVIQNNYSLGITEEAIISNLRNFTIKLILEEKSSRSKIAKEQNPAIKDRVSRAYGILIHSYQIDAVEALNALSLIKLGIELGWVAGIDVTQVNRLFFNCRRAHLMQMYPQKIDQEALLHKRTEYIHEMLQNVSLTI